MNGPLVQPALIGGLVMGVLSALPIISAGNVCCCLWVVCGGLVAAYVRQQNDPLPITVGDGAIVGLLAGVLGAVVYLVISIPITLLLAPLQQRAIERLVDSGSVPPEVREYMTAYVGGVLGIMFTFFLTLFAGIVFSTLGGVIGALVFRKPQPPLGPPGTIDVVPSEPPL